MSKLFRWFIESLCFFVAFQFKENYSTKACFQTSTLMTGWCFVPMSFCLWCEFPLFHIVCVLYCLLAVLLCTVMCCIAWIYPLKSIASMRRRRLGKRKKKFVSKLLRQTNMEILLGRSSLCQLYLFIIIIILIVCMFFINIFSWLLRVQVIIFTPTLLPSLAENPGENHYFMQKVFSLLWHIIIGIRGQWAHCNTSNHI